MNLCFTTSYLKNSFKNQFEGNFHQKYQNDMKTFPKIEGAAILRMSISESADRIESLFRGNGHT